MDAHVIRRPSWLALVVVACFGAVLAGYGRVVSPHPLIAFALMLLWVGVFALACLGAGAPLAASAGGVAVFSPAGGVVSCALGAGVLAMVAFALGSAGWLYAPALAAVVLVAAGSGVVVLARWAVAVRPGLQPPPPVPAALIAVAAVVTALAASVPSAFYDQLHYHLAFPFQWLRAHQMVPFPRQDYSFLPSNMGMLYTYALAVLPAASAQMLHWGMGIVTAAGAAVLARSLAPGKGAWWSVTLLATTPAVMLTATWAASDLGVTAFSVAAWIVAVAAWHEESGSAKPRKWLTCGALVGLAVGCKIVAIATVAVPLAVAILVVGDGAKTEGRRRRGFARVGWTALGAAATFLPWMARNLALKGNPVYPLLSTAGVGGARAIVTASVGDLSATPLGLLLWALGKAHALLLGTFAPRGAGGTIGPAYLMLAPVAVWWLVAKKRPLARPLAVGFATSVAAWSLVPQLGRYLLPALVLAAALEGVAWVDLRASLGNWVRPIISGALALGVAWGMFGAMPGEVVSRVGCALGVVDRSAWMRESVDYWSAAQFINATLPADAKVMLVGEARCMYIDRDVVVEDPYQVPLLSTLAGEESSASSIADRLRHSGVTHLLFNRSEAARIAEMTGREDFFNLRTKEARDRLRRFFAEDTHAVFTDGAVSVLAVADGGR